MTIEKYTLAKAIFALDNGKSDFHDPSGEVTERAAGAVELAAELCECDVQDIRSEITGYAQSMAEGDIAEHELEYGGLNEYGQFPHEVNRS